MNNTFTTEIFNNTSFSNMRKYKTEFCRLITDDSDFTNFVCNSVIGALTPYANCAVHGTFYAKGEALNLQIRKTKQVLGLWNRNCVIKIDDVKTYMIDNSTGFVVLCEA